MMLRGKLNVLPVMMVALSLLTACGNSKYQKQEFTAAGTAGQYVVTKPKVDIVIFQDKSDSMRGPISKLKPSMQNFVNGLSANWDFHFTVLPLLSTKNMSGKYVLASDCSTINTGAVLQCLGTNQVNLFNGASDDSGWINTTNSAIGSTDYGFQNIYSNLVQVGMKNSKFLRPDAALAIIVLSNGEDIEGMGYSDHDRDGHKELDYSTGLFEYNNYRNAFKNTLKGTSALSRFYSVVSINGGTCLGYNSYKGQRYMNMSSDLGSRSYNVCSTSALPSLLSAIGSQMQTIVESVVFNYQVMDSEPMPTSIIVKKNGATLPNSSVDGWTYEGYKVNQNTSFFPTAGNPKTGYFIKLNGTAVISGTDTIAITYNRK